MAPWAGDQLVLYTNTEKKTHKQTSNIHYLSGTRTHDHGFRASEDALDRSDTATGCEVNTDFELFLSEFWASTCGNMEEI
jgi:hypothetical protein